MQEERGICVLAATQLETWLKGLQNHQYISKLDPMHFHQNESFKMKVYRPKIIQYEKEMFFYEPSKNSG